MASPGLARISRARFFALPAHARVQTYQCTRSFAATSANKISLVDIAVAGPNALLDGIHALGIPWSVALPITAVLVRTVLVPYISTGPARRKRQLQNQLVPLAAATLYTWRHHDPGHLGRRQTQARYDTNSIRSKIRMEKFERWRFGNIVMRSLLNGYGVSPWRPRGLLNFGMLIAFTEAIRLKCGARDGLLSVLLMPFTWLGNKVLPGTLSSGPAPPSQPITWETHTPAEILAERTLGVRESKEAMDDPDVSALATQQTSTLPPTTPLEATPAVATPYFEPTMQTEGLPWITDLTIADPTVLPIVLCASMVANTILVPRPSRANWELSIGQRIGLAFALVLCFGAMKMPAAVVLYFAPSILAGWLHGRWMDFRYPIQPPIMPCRRPLRLKVRRNA